MVLLPAAKLQQGVGVGPLVARALMWGRKSSQDYEHLHVGPSKLCTGIWRALSLLAPADDAALVILPCSRFVSTRLKQFIPPDQGLPPFRWRAMASCSSLHSWGTSTTLTPSWHLSCADSSQMRCCTASSRTWVRHAQETCLASDSVVLLTVMRLGLLLLSLHHLVNRIQDPVHLPKPSGGERVINLLHSCCG